MSFSSDSPDAKKPCKGILKSSSSFDKHSSAASSVHRKSAKFDELNVLQTYHPPDKDYGHMKVDEPKTPFNYVESADVDQLDAELLAERLRVAADSRSDSVSEEDLDDDEEEEELTEEQKKRKKEFELRRKAHYNEFEAVKLARKLIEEDEDNDDVEADNERNDSSPSSNKQSDSAAAGGSSGSAAMQSVKDDAHMEIEEIDEPDRIDSMPATKPSSSDSQAARLKPVSSLAMLEDNSDLHAPRSSVIALIMIVSICLMIFFIICFTLLFYVLKRNT